MVFQEPDENLEKLPIFSTLFATVSSLLSF